MIFSPSHLFAALPALVYSSHRINELCDEMDDQIGEVNHRIDQEVSNVHHRMDMIEAGNNQPLEIHHNIFRQRYRRYFK
jgi:hypothetical protein